jgi:co-chaperonin GroES (HSP10)
MILQPLGARIIVKRRKIDKVGSLFVPKNSQEMKVCIGEVVSVGPSCDILKTGDMVTFGRYAPMNVDTSELEYYGLQRPNIIDEEYLLLNEEDALCLIVREEVEKQ